MPTQEWIAKMSNSNPIGRVFFADLPQDFYIEIYRKSEPHNGVAPPVVTAIIHTKSGQGLSQEIYEDQPPVYLAGNSLSFSVAGLPNQDGSPELADIVATWQTGPFSSEK